MTERPPSHSLHIKRSKRRHALDTATKTGCPRFKHVQAALHEHLATCIPPTSDPRGCRRASKVHRVMPRRSQRVVNGRGGEGVEGRGVRQQAGRSLDEPLCHLLKGIDAAYKSVIIS